MFIFSFFNNKLSLKFNCFILNHNIWFCLNWINQIGFIRAFPNFWLDYNFLLLYWLNLLSWAAQYWIISLGLSVLNNKIAFSFVCSSYLIFFLGLNILPRVNFFFYHLKLVYRNSLAFRCLQNHCLSLTFRRIFLITYILLFVWFSYLRARNFAYLRFVPICNLLFRLFLNQLNFLLYQKFCDFTNFLL